MSQVSEIRVRGDGRLFITGGRGPVGPEGAGISTIWTTLASEWTASPTLNSTIAEGDVWEYTYGGTTYYRLVPSPYVSSDDAFYSSFSGGILAGEVANRGRTI